MLRVTARLGLFALLAATACSTEPEMTREPLAAADSAVTASPAPSEASAAQPSEPVSYAGKVFGKKPELPQETLLLDLAKDPAKFADQTVRTSGVVKAVCKKAGCWMEIETGPDQRAHIKMAGHGFFVPKNCDGHRAVVEGSVKSGPPANECGSKDKCGGADNGAVAKLELVATGVEFLD